MQTVMIGTRAFPIVARPIRESRIWRLQAKTKVQEILSLIDTLTNQPVTSVNDVMTIVRQGLERIMDAPDDIYELVFAYIPTLRDCQDEIEMTATDEQIFDAFLAILRTVYPFGKMIQRLGRNVSLNVQTGQTVPGTGSNYRSVNGDAMTSIPSRDIGSPIPISDVPNG